MKYAINVIVTTYTVIVITVRLGLENGGGSDVVYNQQ